ncbi:MAG: hypothetical protein QOE90_1498 [Thermoplasmata archaeon]|nr:hypothetical protein [Thermoplasmata archaeon]
MRNTSVNFTARVGDYVNQTNQTPYVWYFFTDNFTLRPGEFALRTLPNVTAHYYVQVMTHEPGDPPELVGEFQTPVEPNPTGNTIVVAFFNTKGAIVGDFHIDVDHPDRRDLNS